MLGFQQTLLVVGGDEVRERERARDYLRGMLASKCESQRAIWWVRAILPSTLAPQDSHTPSWSMQRQAAWRKWTSIPRYPTKDFPQQQQQWTMDEWETKGRSRQQQCGCCRQIVCEIIPVILIVQMDWQWIRFIYYLFNPILLHAYLYYDFNVCW